MTNQSKSKDRYEVTKINTGYDYISVSITVNDDGSLRIDDHTFGAWADKNYGKYRDVEHWLDLDAAAVRKLLTVMTGNATPDAASELAKRLAKDYAGQNLALRSIKELCDRKSIEYQEERWPW